MSDAGTEALVARALESSRRADYFQPAPLAEILSEQLDYLIAHTSESCPPGCGECARLQQVQGWLLLPFRAGRRTRASRRVA